MIVLMAAGLLIAESITASQIDKQASTRGRTDRKPNAQDLGDCRKIDGLGANGAFQGPECRDLSKIRTAHSSPWGDKMNFG